MQNLLDFKILFWFQWVLLSNPEIDVNITDNDGWSALKYAYEGNFSEVIEVLAEVGAK